MIRKRRLGLLGGGQPGQLMLHPMAGLYPTAQDSGSCQCIRSPEIQIVLAGHHIADTMEYFCTYRFDEQSKSGHRLILRLTLLTSTYTPDQNLNNVHLSETLNFSQTHAETVDLVQLPKCQCCRTCQRIRNLGKMPLLKYWTWLSSLMWVLKSREDNRNAIDFSNRVCRSARYSLGRLNCQSDWRYDGKTSDVQSF